MGFVSARGLGMEWLHFIVNLLQIGFAALSVGRLSAFIGEFFA